MEKTSNTLKPTDSAVLCEGLPKKGLAETRERFSSTTHGRLETMLSKLDDIEFSSTEPEISLPLDLDLDQIENHQ